MVGWQLAVELIKMTWINHVLLACRSLALQPLHCWNILNRTRQITINKIIILNKDWQPKQYVKWMRCIT
jgi:hypothetical protein